MTNLKTWWQGLKYKNDHIILFTTIIASLIVVVTSFGKSFTNGFYFILLIIVICVFYIIINGLIKGEIIFRLDRQNGHINFKQNRRDFIIVVLAYSVVVIIILYNSIKLKFYIF